MTWFPNVKNREEPLTLREVAGTHLEVYRGRSIPEKEVGRKGASNSPMQFHPGEVLGENNGKIEVKVFT